MSDECLKDDLCHYRMENSHEVTTVKPFSPQRIQYDNPASFPPTDPIRQPRIRQLG
jgi:hypothetical protein